jgi:hypothetical protein
MATTEQFVQRLVTVVKDLSLFFAGQPDDCVTAALDEMRGNISAEFARLFPDDPEMLTALVDNMVGTIQARRREIEGAGLWRTPR